MFSYYNKLKYEVHPLPDTENGQSAASDIDQAGTPSVESVGPVSELEGNAHQPTPGPEKESAADKAARKTATATIWIAIFTVILAFASVVTLYVVITGSGDTRSIADATKTEADRMKDQSDRTKELADQMKVQADRTKTIADEAIIQADAARNISTTAERQLGVMQSQQRPWISPSLQLNNEKLFRRTAADVEINWEVSLRFQNVGASPAKRVFYSSQVLRGVSGFHQNWRKTDVCDRASKESSDPNIPGPVIFPGPQGIDIQRIFSTDWNAQTIGLGTDGARWIVVCVVYQDMSGDGVSHYTKSIFNAVPDFKRGIISAPGLAGVVYQPVASFDLVDSEAK